MPTILRFRNFRIMIYTEDHPPAHVHARGPDIEAIFLLSCPDGPVSLRGHINVRSSDLQALADFLNTHLQSLCTAWASIHETIHD